MTTLKLGSTGSEVIKLQNALIKLGFTLVSSSGTFDNKTHSAVISFQKLRVWLVADGIVGPISQTEIDSAVEDVDGENKLKSVASGSESLNLAAINANIPLAKKIQKKLNALGLYPGGKLIDGDFGARSRKALVDFLQSVSILLSDPLELSPTIATALINTLQIPDVLEVRGKDASQVLKKFRDIEQFVGADDNKLAFLDMGVEATAYKTDIPNYTKRLISTPTLVNPTVAHPSLIFSSYPNRASLPSINTSSLKFLDPAITEACVVVGQVDSGGLQTAWFGKNVFTADECLSATKIIPILNVLSQLGKNTPSNFESLFIQNHVTVNNPIVTDPIRLSAALIDIVSYRGEDESKSNALSLMFKNFVEPSKLEDWIRTQTGNKHPLNFEGPYGTPAFINRPEVVDNDSKSKPLLVAPASITLGKDNDISVYDLARLMSMIGWHQFLPTVSQLENIVWSGLESFITALGTDTARYFDVAIETLGLVNVISSPVILSKMGYGNEALVYIAFIQFIDEHISASPKLRSFTIALRTDKNPPNGSQAIPSDTKMAAAVTEIVRRIVMEEAL